MQYRLKSIQARPSLTAYKLPQRGFSLRGGFSIGRQEYLGKSGSGISPGLVQRSPDPLMDETGTAILSSY